jgi:TonB family protein
MKRLKMTYFKQILVLLFLCIISAPAFAENWKAVASTNSEYSAYLDIDSIVQSNNYYFYNVKYYNEKAQEYIIATIQSKDNQAGIVKTCKISEYEKNKNLVKIDTSRNAKELKNLDKTSPIYNINTAAKTYYGKYSSIASSTGSGFGSGNGSGHGNPSTKKTLASGSGGGHPKIDAVKEPDFGPYMRELTRKIKMNWDPPKGNESKRVVLLFKVAKDGRLLSCSVYKSSGLQNADNAAINAVKLAAPFRPLPPEYKQANIDIQFTFDYNVFGAQKY